MAQIEAIKYELLRPLSTNIRLGKPSNLKIEELRDLIDASNWVSPLVVQQNSEGTYDIYAGNRRYYAVGLIRNQNPRRFKELNCEVFERDELDMILINAQENLGKLKLKPYELARHCDLIREKFGLTITEVARRLGLSQPHVSNLIAILQKAHPEILKALSSGHDIPLEFLFKIIRRPQEEQLRKYRQWLGLTPIQNLNQTKPKRIRMRKALLVQELYNHLRNRPEIPDETVQILKWILGMRQNLPLELEFSQPRRRERRS